MYAIGRGHSQELNTLALIDRFGIEAILGRRQFYYGELRRMITAENIFNGFRSRAQAKNWAAWVKDNPSLADLLNEAEQLIED